MRIYTLDQYLHINKMLLCTCLFRIEYPIIESFSGQKCSPGLYWKGEMEYWKQKDCLATVFSRCLPVYSCIPSISHTMNSLLITVIVYTVVMGTSSSLTLLEVAFVTDISQRLSTCNVVLINIRAEDIKSVTQEVGNSIVIFNIMNGAEKTKITDFRVPSFLGTSSQCQLVFFDGKWTDHSRQMILDLFRVTTFKKFFVIISNQEPPKDFTFTDPAIDGITFVLAQTPSKCTNYCSLEQTC